MRSQTMLLWAAILVSSVADLPAQFGQNFSALTQSADELASAAVRKGYRRLGVFPQCTGRQGSDAAESFTGATAAHGKLFAEKLYDNLVERAGGRFEIVNMRMLSKACDGFTVDDLGDPQKLAAVAAKVGGLDALVVGTITNYMQRGNGLPMFDMKCELIAVAGGGTAAVSNERMALSIASLAYAGKSFEIRRWSSGNLENVGLRAEAEGRAFLASDYNPSGGLTPADILAQQCHPLDDAGCPLRLEIVVDGQPRPRTRIGRELYVALDRGEKFLAQIENRTDQDVYFALFVDGLNVLGKKREPASNCRVWQLDKQGKSRLRGWYTGSGTDYLEEAFEVASAAASEAGKQGFLESLGMITAVFYTVGIPPQFARATPRSDGGPMLRQRAIVNPRTGRSETAMEARSLDEKTGKWVWHRVYASMAPGSNVGIRAGGSQAVKLEQFTGDGPGLILAAMTVRYVTSSQLADLRQKSPPAPGAVRE